MASQKRDQVQEKQRSTFSYSKLFSPPKKGHHFKGGHFLVFQNKVISNKKKSHFVESISQCYYEEIEHYFAEKIYVLTLFRRERCVHCVCSGLKPSLVISNLYLGHRQICLLVGLYLFIIV